MLITISGDATHPGVYEVDPGTAVGDLLALGGAGTEAQVVLIGGYGGSWHQIAAVAPLPFTPAGLRPAGASPGAGVLAVLPAASCGITETARILGYLARESARQCGPCQFGLAAIADDFAQLATGQLQGDPLRRLRRRLGVIPGRGACHHPDGAVHLAASALTAFSADLPAHAARRPCPTAQCAVFPIPRPQAPQAWR
jgi:NADH:ubiquinone oxidoreductase subunit F (NADH-binding)